MGGRVAYTGVGINLKTNRPTAEQLRTAIFSVLRDPSYRQRAEEIQHDLAAHDGPAEAADLLEHLAATHKPVPGRLHSEGMMLAHDGGMGSSAGCGTQP